MKRGKMHYGKIAVELYDYWHQPHEVEAREEEERLYIEYLIEKNKLKSIFYFPNRLMC